MYNRITGMLASGAAMTLAGGLAFAQTTTPTTPPPTPPVTAPTTPTTTADPSATAATGPVATGDGQTAATAPAEAPAAAPNNPFDQLLTSAHPFAADPKIAPAHVKSASTNGCVTTLALEGGGKLDIDLKKMQGLSVNTNLMLTGGGRSVQLEFDGKTGAKDAAAADKALAALNDKCLG